ncbi:MAG: molybdopterin-synthase adenylyltransferase MoeB [Deltaproteobacteria bacterium]|jgi:adenylyltransferase/sulfurtransferase|nr:molybdopterin-synthase adenylyltransferase MoeB [Deltaproteobacteria bacterium]
MAEPRESLISDDRLTDLTPDELTRFSRHLLLPEVGALGQKRLKAAKVLIVGAGGLGSPLALYLAAAGVGTIGIVDYDLVEASNLQRQVIFQSRDILRPKVAAASERLKALNPNLSVVSHHFRLTSRNALDLIRAYDVVADGTDNYPTRYLVADACVFLGKPNVYASVFQFEGQATVFDARHGPCYRCLYPSPPPPGLVPSCGEGGVMGVLPGILGTVQASETIKLIVGGGRSLIGRLWLYDAWLARSLEVRLEKNPACPVCGERPLITELVDYESFCGLKNEGEEPIPSITARELKERLERRDGIQVVDIREPHEMSLSKFSEAVAIPFGQLARRQNEFDPGKDLVFICKIGQRSLYAIRALREAGYAGPMFNLQDGLNAWAREVDPSLSVY